MLKLRLSLQLTLWRWIFRESLGRFQMDNPRRERYFDPVLSESAENAPFQFVANAELIREFGYREGYCKAQGGIAETGVERHRRSRLRQHPGNVRDACPRD